MFHDPLLLVGSGPMAVEYAKVLKSMHTPLIVIGRGESSAKNFTRLTGLPVVTGGLDGWFQKYPQLIPSRAVVAVDERSIGEVARVLMGNGIKSILLEKPGGFDVDDIKQVASKANESRSTVFVGYNRRFYSSTSAAKRIIEEDGGITSFVFEFTEWAHVVAALDKKDGVKEQWFLSNSTHVIDLAFFLGGFPVALSAYSVGGLDWHPLGSVFAGAGKSLKGALFSYSANWEAPGRWGLEILTRSHRLIFRPLEKLQIQKIGSIEIQDIVLEDELDKQFKPGLYKQVKAFIDGNSKDLVTISDQLKNLDWFVKIRNPNI